MTKEEIKDFLEVNSQKVIIDYIYNLETESIRNQKAISTARMMLSKSVTKERYNDLVKKYNKLK